MTDEFGVAETLIQGQEHERRTALIEAGILKVRRRQGAPAASSTNCPTTGIRSTDRRRTVWEMVHHLIRVHGKDGEDGARRNCWPGCPPTPSRARELAYRLYRICEQKNRAQEALGYNALVQSWPEIARLARERPRVEQAQLIGGAGTTQ